MRWILEEDENTPAFAAALRAEGTPFHLVEIRPFTHEVLGRGLSAIPEGEPVFVRGPFGLPEACAARGWAPVVWTGSELSEATVLSALGDRYLNADGQTAGFGDLSAADLPGQKVFIKPAGDTKSFSGQVVETAQFEAWRDGMLRSGYVDAAVLDEEVFFAAPKTIGCEWRVFVVGGTSVTACCYRQYQRHHPSDWVPPSVLDFVVDCVSAYDPLPGYVLDVTQVPSGDFKVLELNTLNHAGLYACDAGAVVRAVNAALSPEDLRPAGL